MHIVGSRMFQILHDIFIMNLYLCVVCFLKSTQEIQHTFLMTKSCLHDIADHLRPMHDGKTNTQGDTNQYGMENSLSFIVWIDDQIREE